jgi:uncharacterized protein YqfA (UPF0365 family)
MNPVALVVGVVVVILAIIVISLIMQYIPIGLWITAKSAGVEGVSFFQLFGMRLRRVPQDRIVLPLIAAVKAGVPVTINMLETHFLAGGNVDKVVAALISAHRAQIPLTFEKASAIDLAGRDVLDAIKMSVNPKVIETPVVSGVAHDGVELKAFARITVRANIDQFVGGAGEPTVLARVGEGIVTTIGSAANYIDVMEKPDAISKTVLAKGLDAGTAFEILSIDIAEVMPGQNIGARLQADKAEANMKIARAEAEGRRAMAVAREQEMKAHTQEMQANVVQAQAMVPQALADALRSGNIGVMDYYNLRNIQADTEMRSGIGQATGSPGGTPGTTTPEPAP